MSERSRAAKAVAAIAGRQYRVISRRQALEAGFTSEMVKGRLRSGLWTKLHTGVYLTVPGPPSLEQRATAACIAGGPTAVASHGTAACLLGALEVPDRGPVEITVVRGHLRSDREVTVHRTTFLRPHERIVVQGIPVTSPARTLLGLAAGMGAGELEHVTDAMLRTRRLTPDRLAIYLDDPRTARLPGSRTLRWIAVDRYAGGIPESALETAFDRLVREVGLPRPVRQHPVRIASGPKRLDFSYPDRKLVIELDTGYHVGLEKEDKDRQDALEAMGWRFLRFTWYDVTSRPLPTVMALAEALRLVPRAWRPGRALSPAPRSRRRRPSGARARVTTTGGRR